jgi:uncharacterized protein YjdB
VAAVSDGTVTAVGGGTAVITARSTANTSISASATVIVTVPLAGIRLDPDTLVLTETENTGSCSVIYDPPDTTQTGVTWSSSNPAAATVSNGTVTAVGSGTAVITATSTANTGISAACTATVTITIPVTAIGLPSSLTIGVGGNALLPITYTPANTTQTGLIWSSSNPAKATVSNGTVFGVDVGTAVITATSTENGSVIASCTVTVQASFTGAGVNIVFEGFEDETITLETTVNQYDQLVVTAPAGFDRYLWYMDGYHYITITYPAQTFYSPAPGRHYITVIVAADGYHFSKTLIYTVGY